jgi:hypothetical protein
MGELHNHEINEIEAHFMQFHVPRTWEWQRILKCIEERVPEQRTFEGVLDLYNAPITFV